VTRHGPPSPGPEAEQALRTRAKETIRLQMKAIRGSLPAEARQARSAAVVRSVLALPEARSCRVLATFVPMRSEVDVGAVAQDVRARGGRVALPRVAGSKLVLHEPPAGEPLVRSGFGVMEPPADAPVVDPSSVDLVLVPALAVDEGGHRIGYGRGFYDRLLPTLTGATSVAVVFDFQLVAEVPVQEADRPVDIVATDVRVLRCRVAS